MSTLTYTRQLIEHRYRRPLNDLQHTAYHGTDPVLPVVLRRLVDLADTHEQASVARGRLDAAWQHRNDGDHGLDELVVSTTNVIELEARQHQEAEVIWDLLDIRLLLNQPPTTPVTRAFQGGDQVIEQAMPTARKLAATLDPLNRETLRRGLREHGIHLSNRRLGVILRRLRAERTAF
jgi:hypothetical protein